ncbi:MAG: hypothetical protein R3E83_23100 [Burkholderiaceae bacterium]
MLLLDEATSGLDPLQTIEAREVVRRCGEGRAVLFSSHLMQEVNALCSRVILLLDGRVLSTDLRVADGGQAIRVDLLLSGLEASVAQALLADVPGVAAVEPAGSTPDGALRFRCMAQPGSDPRAALAQAVVARGTLLELQLHEATLEESFVSAVASARQAALA